MATRRRTSAKSAPKIVKESVVSVKKVAVAPVKRVNKVTQHREIKPVTETPTPAKVRPEKPNLSRKDYMDDIKIRWQIHQWEVNEAWEDTKKGYHFVKPYLQKGWNYSLELYALVAKQVKELQEDKPETNQLTN